ncbi:Imm50 family immunity protein [Streptomyces sp. NPDC054863]
MSADEVTSVSGSPWSILADSAVLSDCDLSYVQIDERQSTVVLGFGVQDGESRSDLIPRFKSDEGHNAMEFSLVFTGMRNLTVRGWGYPGYKQVRLEASQGGVVVSVDAPASSLSSSSSLCFEASSCSVTRVRSFLASWVE